MCDSEKPDVRSAPLGVSSKSAIDLSRNQSEPLNCCLSQNTAGKLLE